MQVLTIYVATPISFTGACLVRRAKNVTFSIRYRRHFDTVATVRYRIDPDRAQTLTILENSMTVEKVRLQGLRISVYTRIARLVMEEKQVAYALEEVDPFADGGPPREYLTRHPFGMIPCLLRGDFCLYETTAITRYIDEAFPGPSLQPATAQGRARMNQIISILDSYAYRRMVWDVYVERVYVPTEGGQSDETVIAGALPVISKVLEQLEIFLGDSDFLAGSKLSLADCHAFPMLVYFVETPEGKEMFAAHPKLQRWMKAMQSRSSVQATGFEAG